MTGLQEPFLTTPIAHRALHNVADGRPENSRAAVQAAIDHGYGIEIDIQMAACGTAMVFHDYDLGRLTADTGPVRMRSAQDLASILLTGGDEGIPTLSEIAGQVRGQVPLLVELKDQDGGLGPEIGALGASVAQVLATYDGPLAVMSFNPHAVTEMAQLLPSVPRGLVTCDFAPEDWPVAAKRLEELRGIPDYDRTGSCFLSHDSRDLDRPRVHELKSAGAPVLCWTIRSPEEEAVARRVARNVTFEGYLPTVSA